MINRVLHQNINTRKALGRVKGWIVMSMALYSLLACFLLVVGELGLRREMTKGKACNGHGIEI